MAMLAAAAIAWLGLVVHNVADLPGQTLFSPETLLPGLFTALLLWLHRVQRRAGAAVLLGWAAVNAVIGGVLSVLPLPVWPFDPEQSVRHYSFHLLYAVTQVPLLVAAWQEVRARGER
ncbi:hypothetical protein [Pseudonocardia sp. TRM90224]|uniref:hypothetical protein n=1 Tax=Pseudonocardia sp. TRM90224 TaxID=2812678 RepID=UPI001E393F2A|nr:hypothetical protein [Pseudonocardia sp. TRM90224]